MVVNGVQSRSGWRRYPGRVRAARTSERERGCKYNEKRPKEREKKKMKKKNNTNNTNNTNNNNNNNKSKSR
jgi:hypothetical protein